jgi:hypothetical protein
MKSFNLLVALLLSFVLGTNLVFAQSDRGTIRGTVTDPTGAIVANARVVLTGTETGETRETTTSDEGIYVFPELRPAVYQVSVEAAGFQRSTITDFKVAVQVTHSLNIELQVGAVTNEVTVQADAQALQADTVVIQTNVNERQVKELPLQVSSEAGGRTPLAFIFLDSNVNSTETGSASSSVGGTNASRFRVSGGQALGTEILIDGASTRRAQNGTFFSEVSPGPNAFQEFTLSTSTFSAEFGNSSGGIVNFILKSGTNDFHGEVYDLLRNEKFNANRVSSKINGFERDRDNQNDFGFNVGGPLLIPGIGEGTSKPFYLAKNRAFFFFNYEGYRFTEGENVVVTVPTVRMRNGDFGELLTDPDVLRQFPSGLRIYNPRQPTATRQQFANNIIPSSAFDTAGFNALQAYPLPNRPGVFRNYVASSTRPNNMNQFTIKTDFNISDKQRLNFSYSRRKFERLQGFTGPDGRPRFPRLPEPATAIDVWDQAFTSDFGRLQHNYSITQSVINFFNIGYTYYDVRNANTTEGFNTSSLGIPVGATSNIAFPRILIDTYGEPDRSGDVRAYQSIGSSFFTDRIRDGALDISDFVTWVVGRHTIKFGGSFRTQQLNSFQRIDPGGTFRFNNAQTARDDDPNGGHPIASLITGAVDLGFTRRDSIDPSFTQVTQGYFVQDDFKVTQKLTLNLGLRYDLPGLRTERYDRFRTFDPNTPNPEAGGRRGALVGVEGRGALGTRPRGLVETDKSNLGPRVGAAYAFDNRTVVRAGIGLYFSPVLYGSGGGNEPTPGLIGYNTDRGTFSAGRQATQFLSTYIGLPDVNPTGQFLGANPLYFDENFKTGRTLQYSVDLQRELPFNFVASVSYIGSRADRQRSNFGRINALPLNALRLGDAILNAPLSRITAPTTPDDIAFANAARSLAASAGVALPTSNNAVFTGFNGSVARALQPFPQYGTINNLFESQGESTYDSLRVRVERRFSNGIQAGFSYTASRLITNAAEDLFGGGPLSGTLQNPYIDPEELKILSPNNPPHVFVTNFLAELPFGKGKTFLNRGGIVDAILGGFQISGIFRYQAGTPITVFTDRDRGFLNQDITGFLGNLRPNLTGQPIRLENDVRVRVSNAPDRIRVLNAAGFSAASAFGSGPALLLNGALNPAYSQFYSDPNRFFGNAPAVITDYRSDPFFVEDISIIKKTRFGENFTLELGAEFFNVFNRVRYGLLNTNFASPDFGTKELIERPRVIQLRGRFIF